MSNPTRLGILFCCLLFFPYASTPADDTIQLEQISVVRREDHPSFVHAFGAGGFVETANAVFCGLPLDLQTRLAHGWAHTDFSIRGSSFEGVGLLLEGGRINDPQTGHHNSDIPLTKYDIKRAELSAGMLPLPAARYANAGTIELKVNEPRKASGAIETSAGEFQTGSLLLSASDATEAGLAGRVSLERSESAGYRYDTDFKTLTSSCVLVREGLSSKCRIIAGYQEKEFGAYDFYTPSRGLPSKEWTKAILNFMDAEVYSGVLKLHPAFVWRRHLDKFMLDKTGRQSNFLSHHRTDVYRPSLSIEPQGSLFEGFRFDIDYSEERLYSTTMGRHERGYAGASIAKTQQFLPWLSLDSSLGYTGQAYATGSLVSRVRFSKRDSFYLSAARNIRLPNFTELYYSDPTTVGDEGLDAEKALNYELGLAREQGSGGLGIALFLRREQGVIDWVRDSNSQGPWQSKNLDSSECRGVQAYAEFSPAGRLHLRSYYVYADRRSDDAGYVYKYGPQYARHLARLSVSLDFPFFSAEHSITYKKRPGRDGWVLVHSGLSFPFGPGRNWRLLLRVANLLNTEYQEIEGIPQPGRWAEAGMCFEW